MRRRPRVLRRDEEARLYGVLLVVGTVVVGVELIHADLFSGEEAVRQAFFQTTSLMTGTGFAITDYVSWPTLSDVWPMRLAGTCRRYSNRAIPQLTIAARYHGAVFMLRRWPYQANVMKTFEAIKSSVVFERTEGSTAVSPGCFYFFRETRLVSAATVA